MGKLTVGQKAERTLKLLLGMRNPRVVETLRQYGFQNADLEEGWRRLKALTDGRLAVRAPLGKQDPALLTQLDEWENHWFPVANASLRSRFPDVHEWLFRNLTQTEGAAVVLSVGTFVQRLQKLASEASLAVHAADARALLAARGLTDATLQQASDLLEKLGSVAVATSSGAGNEVSDSDTHAAAETTMWNWYLEWGEIARVAISDRRLLRELGYLNVKRPVAQEDDAEEIETGPVSAE